ncbi:CLUMA_CG018732, isoform A [Clunio marinus]|uniref:CLUMA_CG018732, isoform A n=1 Tax=Clunio marinus TaxID=568069 RepID=A0A1J1J1R6_9DIPT|nr:CLUMA_CG018732, isoform A [Clunio marinus]
MKFIIKKSLFIILLVIVSESIAEECSLQNTCECVYSDGSGYSLKSVIEDDSWLEAITNQNLTFYYHPCGDSKKPLPLPDNVTNDCKSGFVLCMYDINNNKTVLLGQQSNMSFRKFGDTMNVLFTKQPTTSEEKESSITLECTPNAKTSNLYAPLEKIDQVHLTLYSKFSCPMQIKEITHHGFFYTFFVILLTLLFVYLFIGILFNYFFIGARGYELIPNYDFWCRVWRSLKLGYIYVKNGCRVIPTEDSYDAI